jgi:hypothetical protein
VKSIPGTRWPVWKATCSVSAKSYRGCGSALACRRGAPDLRQSLTPSSARFGRNAQNDCDTRRLDGPCSRLGTSRPLPPVKATLAELDAAPLIELAPRLRVGWASRSLAGPLGLLALGSLRPELRPAGRTCT